MADNHSKSYPPLLFYIKVCAYPLMGLLTMLGIAWLNRGWIDPYSVNKPALFFIILPVTYYLSIPIAFSIWLYAIREHHYFNTRYFNGALCLCVMVCFMVATGGNWHIYPHIDTVFGLLAVLGGCFIFVHPKAFFRHAFFDRRLATVAVIGVTASATYTLLEYELWQTLCLSAARACQKLLALFDIETSISLVRMRWNVPVLLSSQQFNILVYQPCSGFEGIFLFIFLLSALLMIDWKMLRILPITELYMIGIIYMHGMNVLRIFSLFLLGYYANAPDAPPWLARQKDVAVDVLHSYIGQIYYIIAFMLFSYIMYRYNPST